MQQTPRCLTNAHMPSRFEYCGIIYFVGLLNIDELSEHFTIRYRLLFIATHQYTGTTQRNLSHSIQITPKFHVVRNCCLIEVRFRHLSYRADATISIHDRTYWSVPQNVKTFGAAFKLGRHEWFALRRLITSSRNSAFTGGFWSRFLKETSQKDGRTKNMMMKRPLHGTLRPRDSPTGEPIQNGRRRAKLHDTQLPLAVAQNYLVLLFPLQLFLCWKFRNFLLRNKAFVYFTFTFLRVNLDISNQTACHYKTYFKLFIQSLDLMSAIV